jgi:hypothetical protein
MLLDTDIQDGPRSNQLAARYGIPSLGHVIPDESAGRVLSVKHTICGDGAGRRKRDGLDDFVVHVSTEKLALSQADDVAVLEGKTSG